MNILTTPNLSDAMDKLGIEGILDGIWGINDKTIKINGKIITIKLTEKKIESPGNIGIDAIKIAGSGDVIVVSNKGRTGMACWGGILSNAAKKAKVVGVIIDGYCRDVDEINELNLPVYAKGSDVRAPRNKVFQEATNVDIEINKIKISPGDWIYADESGVVVIPNERYDEVFQLAKSILVLETEMANMIKAGIPLHEVNEQEKFSDILQLKD